MTYLSSSTQPPTAKPAPITTGRAYAPNMPWPKAPTACKYENADPA